MAGLKLAVSQLKPTDADLVKVLFVTVDPLRDTPDRVQAYAARFNPSFIGLSGTQAQLEKVWNDYGITEAPAGAGAGSSLDHTARITMIDPNGDLRVSYSYDAPVADIVHDVELVLQ
jgi:protein SCO1/2